MYIVVYWYKYHKYRILVYPDNAFERQEIKELNKKLSKDFSRYKTNETDFGLSETKLKDCIKEHIKEKEYL